jgi:hypothetical protein
MELYEAFDRAVASTAGIVKAVRPDEADAPTPLTDRLVAFLGRQP